MARPKEKEVVIDKLGRKHTYKLDKNGKKKAWRKPLINEEITKKMEDLFALDLPLQVVCSQVGISDQTYYNECNRNPQFLGRMERAKNLVHVMAGRTVAKAIKDGDVQSSKWYLEHKDERFKKDTKVAINATTETDPETWTVVTWLEMEFTLKDEENS